MIYIWVSFFALVIIYPFFWYSLKEAVDTAITNLTTAFPTFFNSADITLIQNLWTWSPAIMLIGGIFGVVVYAQRYYRSV